MGKVDLLTNTLQPETGSSGSVGIPVIIAGLTGTAKFDSDASTGNKGVPVLVVSFTVPAGYQRDLQQVMLSSSVSGKMEIKIGPNIIGSKRTAPGNPNIDFKFWPAHPISAGETVEVRFTATNQSGSDVEAYVQSTERPI